MVVPLVAHGHSLGVIRLLRTNGKHAYGPADLALAEDLAARAALAIENARLYLDSQRSVQLRDRVLGTVSHDLRNPLTAIRSLAQMLHARLRRRGTPTPDWLMQGLERMIAVSTAMDREIGDLVDTATLQSGRQLSLQLEGVDLVELTRQLVEDLQFTTRRHQLEFVADADRACGTWDRRRLEQVLSNLLSNAIKYSPNGGLIRVSVTHEPAHQVLLSVADQGIGIPEADLPDLFKPFFRARNAVDAFSGTGIGLAGARRIVEQHGGSMQVCSTEGVGTTMKVRLPMRVTTR